MNIEHKKTALDDDSILYQKRDDSLGKKDTSNLNGKQKIGYFKDYYLRAVLVGIVVVVIAGSLIYNMFFRHENTVLSVAVVGDVWISDMEALTQELRGYYGLTKESDYVSLEHYDPEEYTSQIKLTTYIAAKEIDVFICSEDIFKQYAEMGFLYDLSKELPGDLYRKFASKAVKASQVETDESGNVEQTSPPAPYGIDITETSFYQKNGATDEKAILGIIGNTADNMDNIVKFLEYIAD